MGYSGEKILTVWYDDVDNLEGYLERFQELQSQIRTIWAGGGAGDGDGTEEEQQSWKGARGSAQECQEEVEKGEDSVRVIILSFVDNYVS